MTEQEIRDLAELHAAAAGVSLRDVQWEESEGHFMVSFGSPAPQYFAAICVRPRDSFDLVDLSLTELMKRMREGMAERARLS